MRHQRHHTIHRCNDVRARLAEDDHHHRGLAVHVAGVVRVLHGILHIGHISQPYRSAILVGNNDGPILRGLGHLIVVVNRVRLLRVAQPIPSAGSRSAQLPQCCI